MSHGRPVHGGLLSRAVVMLLVCGLLPSVVRQSDASGVGAVWEKDGLRLSPLHNAYIPGGRQRFPVGPIPSQHEGQLLPEAPGGKPNERRSKASLLFHDSHLIGKLDTNKATWRNLGLGGLAATTAGGGGRLSKASYLQPRVFQGAGGPKEKTMVPLSPQRGMFWKPPPVAPSPLSSKSVISGESPFSQSRRKAPINDGLVSLGKYRGTLNAPKLGNQAPFSRKVSQPTLPRGASEATPAGRNLNKSYLFDSDQTSGKPENVNDVSGDGQHAGQGISHSTSSQNSSPLLKLASQQSSANGQVQSSRKVPSSDVQTSVYMAMLPDPHNGGSTVHHKAQPKAFGRASWLKSRQSVLEDENIKLPGVLGIKNFVSQKFEFGRRPEVVAAATMAPLEVELERGPQKYSIQTGSNSILVSRAVVVYNSEMANESMLSANNVPSQQGEAKALQHSEFPQKLNAYKSDDKGAFGAQPQNLNEDSKTSLQGHMSVNGKYNFGGLTGRPFRTSTSGQLEGTNASATLTMGKYILKPPTNGMLPFKVAREKAPSLRQGSLQGGSAVDRSGSRTSQAEEVASPSLTLSTPDDDDDEEEGSLSIPVTDNHFSKRMPATSNAILVPQRPNHYGEGTISRDYVIPSASKMLTHLPSQAVPRPFEGEVRNDIEETVSVASKTRHSENHPGLTRNANDLEALSRITKFPPNHTTNTQSHSDLGKPYSPIFGFAGSHFSRPQLKPMVTPIDTIHTRLAPIKSNHINYPWPSRTVVRRVRVKGKGVKKPNLFRKLLHTNILGSAAFTSAKVKSQKGSKKMVGGNEERTKAASFSSSPWEGNSAPYPMIYKHEPQLGVAGVSREQAGQVDGRVQFSSLGGAFQDYWSGKAGHRKVLPGLGPVAKGQSGNFVDASSNFVSSAADDEDWNYLKTSAINTSFKSAKVPRSVEATET